MKRFWLAARILLLGFAGTAFAAPFQNGGFESGTPTADPCNTALPIDSTAITGWTVIAGNIDYVTTCWTPAEGARSLDLVGNGSIGGIRQTFDTIPGATYQVSFDLAGNPSLSFNPPNLKPLNVTVAGNTYPYSFNVDGHSAGSMGWATQTFTFTAIGSSTTIDFVSDVGSLGSSFSGAALDNVSITLVAATTTTTLASSANPSAAGSSVTLTATVTGTNNPTGIVQFTDGGSTIAECSAPVTLTGTGNTKTATCTTSAFAVGNHSIVAYYGGDTSNYSSQSPLTQVVNAVPIGAIPWTGSAGSVTNAGVLVPPGTLPPYTGTPIGSSPTVVSDGTTGPAVFTYETVNSYCCHTGDWTFQTTAAAGGNVGLNWTYSGYHGTCQAQASLTAFVERGGSTIFSSTPYSAYDAACSYGLPAGGFGEHGQVVLFVEPGDVYGFRMHASNYDSNGGVQGHLTVTTGTLPTTTTLNTSINPAPYLTTIDFTATVTGSSAAPTGTVTFTQDGRMILGCVAIPLVGDAAVCSTNGLAPGPPPRSIIALYSGDTVNAGSVSTPLPQTISAAGPALAAPTIARVLATSSTTARVIGRVDGASGSLITFEASTAPSCNAGSLVGGSAIGTGTVTTDADGYFLADISGVNSGNFVAVKLTSPATTAMSACVASSGDNHFWPSALPIVGTSAVGDYIDAAGVARWYKVSVTPGQKVQITLSGLPADYDLVVFKDIYAAFVKQLVPDGPAALTRLSAEFAPSTFSPSTFSPSTFSPSTFSPDAYSPSTFSPSTFSPSTFSPSTFSPSTFSPSTFSPSTFSPSTFSPSTFSPSTFSPSTFSPSTFSPSLVFSLDQMQVAQAFSSAQTRSIIGVSATPGNGNESVVVNTWSNTGDFYIRVSARGAAFSTSSQFTLNVTKSATTCANVGGLGLSPRPGVIGSNRQAIILTDSTRVSGDPAALLAKLASLASSVAGAVVDLKDDARVLAYRSQADGHADCPYAKNLLAQEIKSIVDVYRAANPGMRYVVIAGNDNAVPFFRYPDESLLGQESDYIPPVASASASEASLRQDYVLSQDAYGSSTSISMRAIDFPIPGLAVGRLVETAGEIGGMIDAYLANSVVIPSSSLVTGYDFLQDAADAVRSELAAGIGSTSQPMDTLITPNNLSPQDSDSLVWTAADLRAKLLDGGRHDVIFLAGHFSANSALAADFSTSLVTTDLVTSTTDFTNSIVFSAGCHAGYNIVDVDAIDGVTLKLDWPQAFAQKKATLIAGTGYQYGDTEFIEYSERLYKNFARQLRSGTTGTAVAVGEALVRAKLDYLADTPDIRGLHQKALLEATVFGLPMLGVDMPAGRQPNAGTAGVITPTLVGTAAAASLGLKTYDYPVSAALQTNTLALTNLGAAGTVTATWLTGPDGQVNNPAEPALPLVALNVTPVASESSLVLRGVGFLGGSYTDSTIVPLTGAPTTELRGVHTPFLSPVFFPMRLSTPNYFGALGQTGGTKLLVTPAQHRAADVAQGTSTLRQFSGLNLRLYYSGNTTATALSAAPTIVSIADAPSGGALIFTAQVVGDPAAAIHEVWVTYSGDSGASGTWASLPLTQCSVEPPATTPPAVCGTTADSQKWMGQLSSPPANLKYVVQAANGIGLVSLDDNLGAYYSAGATGSVGGIPAGGSGPAATTLALVAPPGGATYGDSTPIAVSLTAGAAPVAGKLVTVSVGGASQSGMTNGSGNATVNVPISSLPGTYQLKAAFSGDQDYLPSAASVGGFSVGKAASNLATPLPLGATLTGAIGGNSRPIEGSVRFTLTSSTRPTTNVWAITDYLGRATLPPPGLPAGDYTVTSATYDGNSTYNGTSTTLGQPISIPKANQAITFAVLPGKQFGDPDFAVTATTTSNLAVSFGAGGPCTVAGSTVHITGTGTCTITASQAGSLDFNAATSVARAFTIAPAGSTTSLSASPTSVVLGAPVTLAATVTTTPAGAGIPSGTTVTFKEGATALGAPVVVSGGAASLTTGSLGIGPHVLTATYGGNANVGSSTGTANVTVGQIPTTTTLTADKTSPVPFGTTINLTATMTPTAATGTVTFKDGVAILGTANATVSGGTTKASFATSVLSIGTHSLTALFAGNATAESSTSAPLTLTIKESFTAANPMLQARVSHTATLLNDGRVLVAGGSALGDDDRRAGRTAEIYCPDPYTPPATTPARTLAQWCPNGVGKFSPAGRGNTAQVGVGNLVQARAYHTATLLPNGAVLLAGGYDSSGITTATAEIYDAADPIADRFTAVANLPGNAAAGHTATLITKAGKALVLVAGGGSAKSWLFDVQAKTWSLSGAMTGVRSHHTASIVGSKVLIAGGTDALGRTLQTTTIYDIAAGTFASGPTMLAPRELHTASAIANGKILFAGGRASTGIITNTIALNTLAEIYDPGNATTPFVASTFASGTGRFGHSASALIAANGQPDGRVLVAGGGVNVVCGQQLAATELFASGAFTSGAAMSAARVRHTATILKDGRVLVAGGRGATGGSCGPLKTVEIWNGPASP